MGACPSFGSAMMLPVAAPYCASVSNGRGEDLIDKFATVVGWRLLLLLAVAVGSGRLWLLWWETDY
jgi:hypothetical protein